MQRKHDFSCRLDDETWDSEEFEDEGDEAAPVANSMGSCRAIYDFAGNNFLLQICFLNVIGISFRL